MINYARERAIEVLKTVHTAVLATISLAGVEVGEFSCEAIDLDLYLIIPRTSDHLFNLERDGRVALHTDQLNLTGTGRVLSPEDKWPSISLLPKAGKGWYVIVKVVLNQVQILRAEGWGPEETIDLTLFR